MNGPIRVICVDDHPLYRYAVEQILAGDGAIELSGVAGDGDAAIALVHAVEPDVILLDLGLPGRDGWSVIESLAAEGLARKVLVLSGDGDSATAAETLRLGVAGHVTKDIDAAGLKRAIEAAARGEMVLGRRLHEDVLRRSLAAVDAAPPILRRREVEIVRRLAAGRSRRAIAGELFLSESTVKAHLASVYRKLGVSNRAAAVANAIRFGILSALDGCDARPMRDARVAPQHEPDGSLGEMRTDAPSRARSAR